jgi:hypothetical protein
MLAIERDNFGDYGNIIIPNTEPKHYTVVFMCILHVLYHSPHLLITTSENTLDTFSKHDNNVPEKYVVGAT